MKPQPWKVPADRRRLVLEALRERGQVLAAELAQQFGCSDDTIRRDLDRLAEEGRIQRVHGGALIRHDDVPSFGARRDQQSASRSAVAAAAAGLVRNGSVVVLDGGTTCLALARQLRPDLKATIFTPSPTAAEALTAYPGVRVELVGGQLRADTMTAFGPRALHTLASVRPDLCVLAPCGLHPEVGLTVAELEDRELKATMLTNAVETIALARSDKVGTVLPFVVGPVDAVTRIVVDDQTPEQQLVAYRRLGVEVVIARTGLSLSTSQAGVG